MSDLLYLEGFNVCGVGLLLFCGHEKINTA
jgi:hypothetical protein